MRKETTSLQKDKTVLRKAQGKFQLYVIAAVSKEMLLRFKRSKTISRKTWYQTV